MSNQRQADAYLHEANVTLEGARLLYEQREDVGFEQVVTNAYAALEQALSAGIAAHGEDIPRDHRRKVIEFFDIYDDRLRGLCLKWQSRRETARYVDFDGPDLSVPSERFDANDAAESLDDAQEVVAFVESRLEAD